MSTFDSVLIYDADGGFIGHAIHKPGADRLQSTNIYAQNEVDALNDQLRRLNEDVDIRAFWPNARDQAVVTLLDDPYFRPLEMIEADVVDDENSYYVYSEEPNEETGESGVLDKAASVIVYKKMMVPARPSDVIQRVKAACEIVARERASR